MTVVLFADLPELQLHFDLMLDSIYITATYRVRLYIFFLRDFAVPLFSPLFDPVAPFLAVPLHMAHPAIPSIPPVPPPTSPPQVVPSLSSDGDPSEVADSSSTLSFTLDDSYALADPSMANGFLSSGSI